jgi:hypothetical protein
MEPIVAGTVRWVIRRRAYRSKAPDNRVTLARRRGWVGLTASRSRDDHRISQGLRARTGLVRVDTVPGSRHGGNRA